MAAITPWPPAPHGAHRSMARAFSMNTQAEVREALRDFGNGQFGAENPPQQRDTTRLSATLAGFKSD